MKTYTEKEVKDILTSVFVFSGVNDNQGLAKITGKNYDEKINTVLNANNTSGDGCIVEAVKKFTI